MIYQIMAILILAAFYTFYFAKIIIQKQQSIKTNQMGIGSKPRKVLIIERIMSCATVLTAIFGVGSIFLVKHFPAKEIRIMGIVIGMIGVFFLCVGNDYNENQLESWNPGGENVSNYRGHLQME